MLDLGIFSKNQSISLVYKDFKVQIKMPHGNEIHLHQKLDKASNCYCVSVFLENR